MAAITPYILGLLLAILVIVVVRYLDRHLMHNRGRVPYPVNHSVAAERVLRVVDLIAAAPDQSDDELVAAMVQEGAAKVDAELLVRFLPIAFSWAVFAKMGVSSFPGTFVVFDQEERPVEMPIAGEHYFTAALLIARDVTTNGFSDRISRPTFESIIARSAEMNAANNALAAGRQLAGGVLAPPVLMGITAEDISASRSPG
jgi:hypothetical protein